MGILLCEPLIFQEKLKDQVKKNLNMGVFIYDKLSRRKNIGADENDMANKRILIRKKQNIHR